MVRISDKVFNEIVDIVYREAGIVLDEKRELLEARLASLARKKKYSGPEEILEQLKADQTGKKLVELLDQVSTNLTFFFREQAHFKFMSEVWLPELTARKKAARKNRIRIWSAACSSGEEPYSLAMTALDYFNRDQSWDFKILATDISTRMLKKGIVGEYGKKEVEKTPTGFIQKFFNRKGTRLDPIYEVKDEVKKVIAFRRLNLLEESYPFSGRFDLIICRNVMIYFDTPTKQALLGRFHRYMEEGGYLFTGHAESLANYQHLFKRIQVAVYQK